MQKKPRKSVWMSGEIFERLDIFGRDLPTFVIKGKPKIKTQLGGFITLVIITVIVMYGGLKYSHLWTRHNP